MQTFPCLAGSEVLAVMNGRIKAVPRTLHPVAEPDMPIICALVTRAGPVALAVLCTLPAPPTPRTARCLHTQRACNRSCSQRCVHGIEIKAPRWC